MPLRRIPAQIIQLVGAAYEYVMIFREIAGIPYFCNGLSGGADVSKAWMWKLI